MSEWDLQEQGCLKGSESLESTTNVDGNSKVTSWELSVHKVEAAWPFRVTPPTHTQQLLLLCNSAQEPCKS